MARRENHQFGVPTENVNVNEFGSPGVEETPEVPMPGPRSLDRVELQEETAQQSDADSAAEAAEIASIETRAQKVFGVGMVVKPAENTLRGYKFILREGQGVNDVMFAPYDYRSFDGIIERSNAKSAAFSPHNPYYEDYAPLRRNIAILRNYLLVTMLFDNKDPNAVAKMEGMAKKLGQALAGTPRQNMLQRWWNSAKRLVTGQDPALPDSNAFLEAANVPDRGIAVMYDYLFGLQPKPTWRDYVPFNKKMTPKFWELAPRTGTPFSEDNILLHSRAGSLLRIAGAFDKIATKPVDSLSNEDKKVSIDHARTILDKLKVFFGSRNEEVKLSPVADPKKYESMLLLRAALAFQGAMADAFKANPGVDIFKIPELQYATAAMQEISYRIKVEALNALMEEGDTATAKRLVKHIQSTPLLNKNIAAMPITDLIKSLEAGFNKAEAMALSGPARSQNLGVSANVTTALNNAAQDATRRQQDSREKISPAIASAINDSAVRSGKDTLSDARIGQISNVGLLERAREVNERNNQPQEAVDGPYVGPRNR